MIIEDGILKEWNKTKRIEENGIYRNKWEDNISRQICIPSSVKIIGGLKTEKDNDRFNHDIFYPAFMFNVDVVNVAMTDSVSVIGEKAFEHCVNLKSIKLSNRLTKIGINAFLGCESLTDIWIPRSVTLIDEWAFDLCPKLVIHCAKDSYVEKYAIEKRIQIIIEDD